MWKFFIYSILFVSLASGLPRPGVKPEEISDSERKLINTPILCQNGEEADANGNCKEVLEIEKRSVSVVPECLIDCTIPGRDCPEGQELDENGNCRDVWGRRKRETKEETPQTKEEASLIEPECIIGCNIPGRCPDGQKPDPNGNCRDDWGLKEEEEKDEESILTRALKPKKSPKKRIDDEDKPEVRSMKMKVAGAKMAKAKLAKAKVVKGKSFLLLKKKKKKLMMMTTSTTEAPDDEFPTEPPGDPFPPFPDFPTPPPEGEEELKIEICDSPDCKAAEVERKLKTINMADTWENWSDDSEEESEEESDETGEYWETEELDDEEPLPQEIDEELLEKLIEMKVETLMQMWERRRRYGPLLAKMMSDEIEEEEKRNKKKKKRS